MKTKIKEDRKKKKVEEESKLASGWWLVRWVGWLAS